MADDTLFQFEQTMTRNDVAAYLREGADNLDDHDGPREDVDALRLIRGSTRQRKRRRRRRWHRDFL